MRKNDETIIVTPGFTESTIWLSNITKGSVKSTSTLKLKIFVCQLEYAEFCHTMFISGHTMFITGHTMFIAAICTSTIG